MMLEVVVFYTCTTSSCTRLRYVDQAGGGRGVFEDVAMLMFFRGLYRGSARTTMSSHTGDGADIHQRRALVGDGGGEAVVAAEV